MSSAYTSNGIHLDTRAKFGTFLPELYTVATGAYAGSGATAVTHTAGAAFVQSYWAAQFQNGTSTVPLTGSGTDFLPGIGQCTWTLRDGFVEFEMIITLDKSPAGGDPITTGSNEIRIRPYVSGVANEPAIYQNRLPPPDQHYPMPVFDVNVFTKTDVVAGPFGDGTNHFELKAHLLMDGHLALVLQTFVLTNGTASTLSALTATLLGSEFTPAGWATADSLLRFYIHGHYKASTGGVGRVGL